MNVPNTLRLETEKRGIASLSDERRGEEAGEGKREKSVGG
jgi:hypothetical protein